MTIMTHTPRGAANLLTLIATRISPDAELLTLSWCKHTGVTVHVYDAPSFRRAVDDLDLTVDTAHDGRVVYARGLFNGDPVTAICRAEAAVQPVTA